MDFDQERFKQGEIFELLKIDFKQGEILVFLHMSRRKIFGLF
jgi:hypothetical protein